MTTAARHTDGILLIYHRPTMRQFVDADNVRENIEAFGRHSRFRVFGLNTDSPLPPRLDRVRFDAILLHYSAFIYTDAGWLIPPELLDYVARSDAYKIVTFQDEYHATPKRFEFIDDHGIDCVYTMLEAPYAEQVYRSYTKASRVLSNLPGYVGEPLLRMASRFHKPDRERSIDVSYRGRPMPPYMGRGAQEKREIGERFAEAAAGSGLRLDIGTREEDRIYGEDWNRFLADSKATLGVESGISCLDPENEVIEEYERLRAAGEEPTLERLEQGALGRWDGRIPYRTISPRNFEAAALRVCQILYEGSYSGAMEPMRHYIPLRKDLSNVEEAIATFGDERRRTEIAETAHRDLIASGTYGYERLVAGFDEILEEQGLSPAERKGGAAARRALRMPARTRLARARQRWGLLPESHPRTWKVIWALSRPVVVPVRALRRGAE
jgi:hypothetical protein